MVMIASEKNQVKAGKTFGKLTVIGSPFRIRNNRGTHEWRAVCECSCSNISVPVIASLQRGISNSCGCGKIEGIIKSKTKHGMAARSGLHKIYVIWRNMRARCYSNKLKCYHNYGGRGITVANEWQDNFNNFRDWAISNGYENGLQLDRIDNNGPYCKENCRFITRSANCRNKRQNKLVEAWGEKKTLIEWSEDRRCQVNYGILGYRIRNKWGAEKAINTPK